MGMMLAGDGAHISESRRSPQPASWPGTPRCGGTRFCGGTNGEYGDPDSASQNDDARGGTGDSIDLNCGLLGERVVEV